MLAWPGFVRNMFLGALLTVTALFHLSSPGRSLGRPVRLRRVTQTVQHGRLRLGLVFDGRPTVRAVKSGNPNLVVFDFSPVVYPGVRRRISFSGGLALRALLAQNDRRRVRLAVSLREDVTGREKIRQALYAGAHKGWVTFWLDLGAGAVARVSPKALPPGNGPGRRFVVVVDPGHGGRDPGALGARSKEKDIVLAVGLELARELNRIPGIDVRMTRTKDEFIRLSTRSKMTEQARASLFISLHCNSARRKSTRGLEIYTLSGDGATDEVARGVADKENSVLELEGVDKNDASPVLCQILCSMLMTDTLNQSVLLAGFLEKALRGTRGLRFRGHKKANFYVLRLLKVPAVLVELGFISNAREEKRMMTPQFKKTAARKLARGISRYLSYIQMREGEFSGESTVEYKVRPGDTLGAIARKYQTTVDELRRLNCLGDSNFIGAGQVLLVPFDPINRLLWGKAE